MSKFFRRDSVVQAFIINGIVTNHNGSVDLFVDGDFTPPNIEWYDVRELEEFPLKGDYYVILNNIGQYLQFKIVSSDYFESRYSPITGETQ